MSDTGGDERQAVLPQLRYQDPGAAVEWLCRAFAFEEASRLAAPDGTLRLADLRTPVGGAVLVGGLSGPIRRRMEAVFGAEFRAGTDPGWPHLAYAVTVMVPDVDAHFARARAEGARLVSEPRDQPWGLRDYEAVDLEGRVWNFSQHLRTAEPEDWGAKPS
jgi:uncharacterized glyoxalase superfamily protein PhnB